MPTRPAITQLATPSTGAQRRCNQALGNSRGATRPRATAASRPITKALLTDRTNCCKIRLTPQVASNVSRGRP